MTTQEHLDRFDIEFEQLVKRHFVYMPMSNGKFEVNIRNIKELAKGYIKSAIQQAQEEVINETFLGLYKISSEKDDIPWDDVRELKQSLREKFLK